MIRMRLPPYVLCRNFFTCPAVKNGVGVTPTVSGLHCTSKRRQSSSPIQVPVSRPVGKTKCTLIPGDGVGPELAHSVKEVFKAAGVPVEFHEFFLSEVNPAISSSLEDVADAIRANGVALKGAIATPTHSWKGETQSLDMKLRLNLDLFAHVARIKSLPGLNVKHRNMDFVLIREQTEGEHLAIEHESVPGVVECLKIVTRQKSQRIAKFAFDYAVKYGRKQVTAVHKANIMKIGDGLFLRCCEEIAELYPQIEFKHVIIDNCTMQMVSRPQQFDVLVMTNLYGDILDNLAAGIVGGAGVVAGESYSQNCVVFEQGARHTYHEAVGLNVANPTAMLLCACNMLRHLHLEYFSSLIERAILKVLKSGKVRTKDIGGHATTTDFTKAVIYNFDQ